MGTSLTLTIFISTLLIGLTIYSIYSGFGAASSDLRDPFDES